MNALRKVFLATVFIMLSLLADAQSTISARLVNLRSDKGLCRICIFDKPQAFRIKAGQPLQCIAVPVRNGVAEASFSNLAPGTYALFVFHDANGNGKFDTNFLGIPKEGYGASRNSLPFAAAPSFENNKLQIASNTITSITIRIRNL